MRIFQRVMQSEIVCETVQKISPRYTKRIPFRTLTEIEKQLTCISHPLRHSEFIFQIAFPNSSLTR
jgi:hypothetical protein